mgnify:FL=1
MAEKSLDSNEKKLSSYIMKDNRHLESGMTSLKNELVKVKNDAERLYELENEHFSVLKSIEESQLFELRDTRKIVEETRHQVGVIVDSANSSITSFQMLVGLVTDLINNLIFTKSLVATTAIFQLIMAITLNIFNITIGYVTGFLNDGTFMLINLGMSLLSLLYPAVIICFIKHARKNMIKINNKENEEGDKDDRSNS